MRSHYMPILENAGAVPKEWELPNKYEASIAAMCVRQLAKNNGVENLRVKQSQNVITVWIGQERRFKFIPPKRAVGPYQPRAARPQPSLGEATA